MSGRHGSRRAFLVNTAACGALGALAAARPAAGAGAAGAGAAGAGADTAAPAAPASPPPLRFRTVEGVDGVPLNVVEAGDPAKPAILFVHGIGQSYLSFEPQLQSALANEFHLVAFDLRGHGNSGKPWSREAYVDSAKWAGDLERVRLATGLERPVLLGWSYGTLVTGDYLRHYGTAHLAGIVIVGAYGGFTPRPPDAAPARGAVAGAPSLPAEQASPDLVLNIAAARQVALLLTAKPMSPQWEERATLIGMLLPAPAHAWMFDRPIDNEDVVGRITVPFLVCVGGRDRNTPRAGAEALLARVAGARLALFPDSGHSPFLEDTEHFNRELAGFARVAFAPR